jgi:hypothetical protein
VFLALNPNVLGLFGGLWSYRGLVKGILSPDPLLNKVQVHGPKTPLYALKTVFL